LIQGLLVLNEVNYHFQRWHGTLLTAAIALLSTFVNTFCARYLPTLERVILVLHLCGFFACLIPLWVMAKLTPSKAVFTQFTNAGGWPSLGLACLVGQITPIFSFLGMKPKYSAEAQLLTSGARARS
jgi:amino acid transporter